MFPWGSPGPYPHSTVIANCPNCGNVQTIAPKVRLLVCDNAPERSTYEFVCPSCLVLIEKPACGHVIAALMSVGVRAEAWNLPEEMLEPHCGAPLTADDLIDFHEQLKTL